MIKGITGIVCQLDNKCSINYSNTNAIDADGTYTKYICAVRTHN